MALFLYLQARFASLSSGIGNSGQNLLAKVSTNSLLGQFSLVLLLGVVWSPCVGPILGVTITLASQGQHLGHVFVVMASFGIGAGLPFIVLGLLSRRAMLKIRNKLFTAGKVGKQIFDMFILYIGIMILTGADKSIEAFIVEASPDWLINLTARF